MRFSTLFASAALSVAVLTTSSAFGAAWTQPSGSTNTFDYSGGLDDNNLFKTPFFVDDDGFTFLPGGFSASSSNGVGSVITDRLQVRVDAKPNGAGISGVSLNERGDYSINDGGDVKEFAYLLVRVLDANYGPQKVFTVQSTPSFTASSTGDTDGEWTDTLSLVLPAPARSIVIVLNNNLHAGSTPGNGSSVITKKYVGSDNGAGLSIIIPEPTTLTAMVGGLGLLVRRRKA